ncbi:MAG: hypothetical protein ACREB3_07485, partial [Burkholderiales bacterium]
MPLVSPLAQYSLLALVAIVAVAFVLGFRRAGGPQLVWAKPPRWAVWAFNLIGLALLINIVTIAILSAPTPLRQFWNEPANTFVAYAPYV